MPWNIAHVHMFYNMSYQSIVFHGYGEFEEGKETRNMDVQVEIFNKKTNDKQAELNSLNADMMIETTEPKEHI